MGPRPPSSRGQDLREDNGGGGERAVREQAPTRWLSDGWEGWVPADGWEGWVPAPFTGAGSRREDNGGERDGRFANSPYQMVVRRVGGMGPRPPSSRGQDLDARTTGGGGRAVREQAPTRWLSDGSQGWVPAPRLHGGRISTRGQRGEGDGRFANSPYQMVVRRVGGMGPRPPSSRGQDLDARTTGGRGTGGSRTSPYQMVVRRVGGMGPRPPSSRGQDLDARTTGGGG